MPTVTVTKSGRGHHSHHHNRPPPLHAGAFAGKNDAADCRALRTDPRTQPKYPATPSQSPRMHRPSCGGVHTSLPRMYYKWPDLHSARVSSRVMLGRVKNCPPNALASSSCRNSLNSGLECLSGWNQSRTRSESVCA